MHHTTEFTNNTHTTKTHITSNVSDRHTKNTTKPAKPSNKLSSPPSAGDRRIIYTPTPKSFKPLATPTHTPQTSQHNKNHPTTPTHHNKKWTQPRHNNAIRPTPNSSHPYQAEPGCPLIGRSRTARRTPLETAGKTRLTGMMQDG